MAGSRIVFRVDASVATGTGHVMRCVTLANAIRAESPDARIEFACADPPGNMNAWLRDKGWTVHEISAPREQDAAATLAAIRSLDTPCDWLIVDHYGLDATWEKELRPHVGKILAIDDLADRPHACDALLDQNFHPEAAARYRGKVPPGADLLLGPQYALLRPDFAEARASVDRSQGRIRNLFIFFGGTDPTRDTLKAIEAARLLNERELAGVSIDVVVGASNPERDDIRTLCALMPDTRFHCQIDDMAARMAAADLSIGAGGTTTWERLCVGLPSIVIAIADNQIELSEAVHARECELYLGRSAEVSAGKLAESLRALLDDPERCALYAQNGMAMVDGLGAQRAARYLLVKRDA